jgi:sigma-B regulation protein RsbU (phosphoserine phosphatase)
MEEAVYKTHTFKMEKGDTLVLYTDGVTEAMNNKGELYTETRFINILKEAPKLSLEDLIARIQKDIEDFVQGAPSSDDITLLCIKQQV